MTPNTLWAQYTKKVFGGIEFNYGLSMVPCCSIQQSSTTLERLAGFYSLSLSVSVAESDKEDSTQSRGIGGPLSENLNRRTFPQMDT